MSNHSKNILEFCLSPDLGGLELFMVNCFNDFKSKGNCKVIVTKGKKLDIYIDSEDKHYIKRNKFFPIIPALKLAMFIDTNAIDIIHFHWTRDIATVVIGRILSKRKPKLVQTRNMTMTRFKNNFYHKWLYKNLHTIHAVTYQVKEQLERFIPQKVRPKIEVIYMGTSEKDINVKITNELKEKYKIKDEFIVGIVGRIEEKKGQYLLIEALAKLKKLNIKVMIVGHTMDESYLNALKKEICTLGLTDRVIFTGFTKEVDAHMQLFDINVLATEKETFGLVVIEAMINKVCIIATNSGGPLEIIDDGNDGLLFNRTSDDLAQKIKLLYHDVTYLNELATAGYMKAQNIFNNSKQNDKLYCMFMNMLNGNCK